MISPEFAEKLSHFPNLKKHFGGIFSADSLPIKIKPKSFIICNTDVEKGPGKHWYCVVKLNTSVLECFDSLGIDSEKKLFLETHFHQKNIKKVKFILIKLMLNKNILIWEKILYNNKKLLV